MQEDRDGQDKQFACYCVHRVSCPGKGDRCMQGGGEGQEVACALLVAVERRPNLRKTLAEFGPTRTRPGLTALRVNARPLRADVDLQQRTLVHEEIYIKLTTRSNQIPVAC